MSVISVTIIEKLDHSTILKCARCGGSGEMFVVGISSEDYCDACDGLGEVKVNAPPSALRDCNRCGGRGRINVSNVGKKYKTCPQCNGAGVVSVDDINTRG